MVLKSVRITKLNYLDIRYTNNVSKKFLNLCIATKIYAFFPIIDFRMNVLRIIMIVYQTTVVHYADFLIMNRFSSI